MERHELHNKIIQQLRFHRISGLDEEECANNILSIVQKDWSEGCSCYHGDTTGETWCCNKCGKPTSKHPTTLPSDEASAKKMLKKHLENKHYVFFSSTTQDEIDAMINDIVLAMFAYKRRF